MKKDLSRRNRDTEMREKDIGMIIKSSEKKPPCLSVSVREEKSPRRSQDKLAYLLPIPKENQQ